MTHTGGMGNACQVCTHPELVEIHQALLTGSPRRRVARAYGLDPSAMSRHWRLHIPAAIRGAAQRAEDSTGPAKLSSLDGSSLLGLAAEQYERSKLLLDQLQENMDRAGPTGLGIDVRAIVAALREVRQSVETLAKLSFAVADRPGQPEHSESPMIDAAIVKALESRGISVSSQPVTTDSERVRELLPAHE